MQITCPNDASHKEFYVTAHVTETWVVAEDGSWLNTADTSDQEVVHRPDSGDLYTCRDCGREAVAK